MSDNGNIMQQLTSSLNMNPLELADKLGELVKFIPKIKEMIPRVSEYEKTINLQPGETVIYSLIPKGNEVFFIIFVMKLNERKETILSRQVLTVKLFEKIEEFTALVPAM